MFIRTKKVRYGIKLGNRYKKDLKRLVKSGYNISKLEEIIDLLAQEKELPRRCKDHELKGELKGIRECHIAPDWLLMYQKDTENIVLILIRTGTHRDVLGIE
ncbi:type II toxin-antitoxin system mRNA interferase toxin, RelE/StbE family [Candidatus Peregrinibacteria bacterium CG10_big_fil_rev_8_21_14_0_10_49_24]|nr:MAG: type II toxin-antitoxin system mRNA interferase toxin, RelE/StbE family [Candidatus Peregrinibacteria bacterium CG11_big_fil_rev_8_21_14_0_20_49_14]PIR51009.1 MAG: type II toxin-antitoxin system mRNA interferase toxin, RelE/StbE family [Candidatus Peregrinibacteria bacterium CG10_big_fil_rev_8_21_14_0_10_49_24]PJA67562.1 MAG: type II toxin-antitoxin system mRNA interferase toxin, RelE/StbE family [Candidatus Peregrinibacteria bacterium CG_4_9_14_3_um_filter_49_12]